MYEQKLVQELKENFLVNNDDKTIDSLKNQIEKQTGQDDLYGTYDNYSSSLRILNDDGRLIDSTLDIDSISKTGQLIRGTEDNKFLFLNSTILNEINNSPTLTYDYANKLLEIPIFIQKLPEKKPTDKDELAS
jgi:hypothetical protein